MSVPEPINVTSPADVLIVPSAALNRAITVKQPKNLSIVLSVCGEALKNYGDQPISSVKILILLQHILVSVKKITTLNDEEQKQLALDSIHWLIDQQKGLTDEEKTILSMLSETVFPQAIELLTEVKLGCMSCFTKCTA